MNESDPVISQTFQARNVIHKVSIYRNYMLLACGNEGADIYGLQKKDLQRIRSIRGEGVDIKDISAHRNELYVLDSNDGLLFYEFYGNDVTLLDKKISIKRGIKLAQFEGKLFFILFQLNFDMSKLAEIFYKDGKFYVNNAYDYMSEVYEVQLFDEMVAAMDRQIQTFIYHSIYEEFLEDKNRHFDYYGYRYQESGLKHINLISFEMIPRLIIGITSEKLVAVELKVTPARIRCYFPQIEADDRSMAGQHLEYLVNMNSTICPSQSYQKEYDQFMMCKVLLPA